MKKVEKILFPTDYSKFSNDAIEYAIAFTRAFHAHLYVMHVVELSTHDPANPLYKKPALEEYTDVKDFVKQSTEKQVEKTEINTDKFEYEEINVMGLSAGREIIKKADSEGIDLIIMASRGAGFFEKLLLGSTSEMVIKEANCPVLISRGEREFVDFDKDEIVLNSILCPVDFSEYSTHALESALFLAEKTGAEITLLHVVEEMFESMDFLFDHFSVDEFNEKREEIADKKLKELIKKSNVKNIKVKTAIEHGNPKKEISEYARENKSGLVVLGAYGRGEEDGIVFSGSVTMKVVKTTDCPVLVVR